MTTDTLPSGLRGHAGSMNQMRKIFADHGGTLTQDQFDKLFSCLVQTEFSGWYGEDYLLGMNPRYGMWGYWLDLLQHMIAHKLASQSGKLPHVVYAMGPP